MTDSRESILRKWRTGQGLSLDEVCDLLQEQGIERPSAAKLSRIERDQDIPVEMIPAIKAVTGISAQEQRPDLAKLFGIRESAR